MNDLPPKNVLVVTDLDGTLLDHDDYSYQVVLPVLDRLRTLQVPVVANTSKTKAEWLAMRPKFNNEAAFVVENGSAIIFSTHKTQLLGSTRNEITKTLNHLKRDFQFQSFRDLGLAGIMTHTGLPESAAALASERDYSEPLLWQDSDEKKRQFCEEITRQGLTTLEGGRFLHVLGATDKGQALDLLRDYYKADLVIALGDSPNDIAMLERADIACVIEGKRAEQLQLSAAPRILRSTLHGPSGWAELMTPLLDELFPNH